MNRRVTLKSNDLALVQAWNRLQSALMGAGGSSSPAACFVFQPGGTQRDNVYSSWPDLVQAAAAVAGYKQVLFDDSLSPCSIPAGIWNFGSYTTFEGRPQGVYGSNLCEVVFLQDAQLVNVFEFLRLAMTSQSNVPVIESRVYEAPFDNAIRIILGQGTTVTGTQGPFGVANGGPIGVEWWLTDTARVLFYDETQPVIASRGRGPRTTVFATDAAQVENYTLAWDRNSFMNGVIVSSGASIASEQITGGVAIELREDATKESYSPTETRSWSGDPTTQQEALDRIAAAVSGLLGGPIP